VVDLLQYHKNTNIKTEIFNQPPRPHVYFALKNQLFTAATPPSKGGERSIALFYPDTRGRKGYLQ